MLYTTSKHQPVSVPWWAVVVAVLGLQLPLAAASTGHLITKLKRLYPRTPLIVQGKVRAVIVAPADPAIQEAARELRAVLKRHAGTSPEVLDVSAVISPEWQVRFDVIAGRTVVALGNINDNRFLAALWGKRFVVADSVFPGPGGTVVRTVHDPFGRGFNVLVLAGSDAAGVRKAVHVFCRKYVGRGRRDVVLDRPIVDVAFTPVDLPFLPPRADPMYAKRQPQYRTADVYRKRLCDEHGRVRRIASGNVLTVLGPIASMAEAWFWNGDPGLPPLMKAFLDRNRALLGIGLERVEMEPGTAELLHWWDVVEELPVWTDRDRLDITNAFLRDSRLGHERRAVHRLVREGYTQVIDENHGTFAAWRDFQAWWYFHTYYHLSDSRYWLDVARAIYAGQCATHQILEDSAGYMCYAPDTTMSYAFATGDLRYLDSGIARDHADYIAQVAVNNLGLSTGFGDSPLLVLPSAYQVIAKAAWYYRDPALTWAERRLLPRATALRAFQAALPYDLEVPARPPGQWTGLRLFPIYKLPPTGRQPRKQPAYAPREPAGPMWFNKVVFREALKPDAQYLLLDTAGRWIHPNDSIPPGPAGHKHDDVNTIINFTDKGRMWLVDHTYSLRSIKDHSGLYITRNGQVSYRCHEAKVLDHGESERLAFVRSVFENFSGADWERNIFWLKGQHFVVIDRVIAKEPGDFMVRASFRGLGKEQMIGHRMRLAQQGKFCDIVTDGEGGTDIERYAYDNPREWQRWYPYAAPIVKILQVDKRADLRPGQTLVFRDLLAAADSTAALDRVEFVAAGDSTALVRDRKGGPIALYGVGPCPGGLASATMFAATPQGWLGSGVTRIGDASRPLFTADVPVTLAFSRQGTATVEVARGAASIRVVGRPQPVRLPPGRHRLSWPAEDTAQFLDRLFAAAEQSIAEYHARRAPALSPGPAENGIPVLTVNRVDLGGPLADFIVADLDGDGTDEWVVTGAAGVKAYRPDGTVLWRFATDAPGTKLAAGDLDGDGRPEIAAGCENGKLYLLDSRGRKQWDFQCKASQNKAGPPAPVFIRIVDLDRDGRNEVVVGANWVHCLAADSTVKWEDYLVYSRGRISGDFRCGAIADFNGDGRLDVLALFYYTYHSGLILGADGRTVYPPGRDRRKKDGLYKIPLPQEVLAGNVLGGPGTPHFVLASDTSMRVYWALGKHAGKVAASVGGDFRALAMLPVAKSAPIFYGGTDMGRVLAVRAESVRRNGNIKLTKVWSATVGEKITALWAGKTAHRPRPVLCVGTKPGTVFAFDAMTGASVGRIPSQSQDASVLKFVTCSGRLLIVRQNGSIILW